MGANTSTSGVLQHWWDPFWCYYGGNDWYWTQLTFNELIWPQAYAIYANRADLVPDLSLQLRSAFEDAIQNSSSFLAEIDETAASWGGACVKLYKAYKCFTGRCKSRPKGPRKPRRFKPACAAGGAWLNYAFNISPTVQDVYGQVEALREDKLKRPKWHYFSVRATRSDIFEYYYMRYERQLKRKITGTFTVSVDAPAITFGNPAEWAWERIPFSFVCDWMLPIGPWIGSLDACRYIERVDGSDVRRYKVKGQPARLPAYYAWAREPKLEYREYNRLMATMPEIPPFPRFKFGKAWQRIAHGVSLLTVMRDGCSKAS